MSDALAEKGLPCNVDAERFVLGSILLDAERHYPTASAGLQSDDFSQERHRRLFAVYAVLQERAEKIDRVTVANELMTQAGLDAVGGLTYLVDLTTGLPDSPNVESYIRILREKAQLRKLIFTAQNVLNRAAAGTDSANEIIAGASESLLGLQSWHDTPDVSSPIEIVRDYGGVTEFLDPSKVEPGLNTGYRAFDEMTNGLKKGDLILVGARPSMGKTAWLCNVAEFLSVKRGKRVVLFSLEMSKASILQRMMCGMARVDSHKFRAGTLGKDDRRKMNIALDRLNESPLLIDDTPMLTVMDIRAKLLRIRARYGPVDLVGVDYLQLLASKGKSENRNQEVAAMTRGLKTLARHLQVPMVVLVQLSRAVEQRSDHRPKLSDLRESGELEQAGDLIAFLYRAEVYNKNREDLRGLAELIIEKQRNGPTGTAHLIWLAAQTRFENRAQDEPPEEED